MFSRFRNERKALVVKEKMMQSTARPMRGPCTPMSLLAHEAPRRASGADAVDSAAPSFVWGFAIKEGSYVSASPKAYERQERVRVHRCRNGEKSPPGFPSRCAHPEYQLF